VLGWLLRAGLAAGLVVVLGAAALGVRTRLYAPAALLGGSLLTAALLAVVGGLMLLRWELFFTGFHELFFAPGTWTFPYSDTLIRLYPEQFWADVGLVIVGLILLLAALVGGGALLWSRQRK